MSTASDAPSAPLLSVVVPVYNEAATIDRLLAAVRRVDIEMEIIIVDDGSTDGTRERLEALAAADPSLHVLYQPENRGKGAAVRAGFAAARGRFVLIQDADLEYDPADYPRLLKPLVEGQADVVFGSRFLGGESHRVPHFWHWLGNKLLTYTSNVLTNLKLSDMETCYKAFRREILDQLALEEDGFGFDPEITAKLARCRRERRPLRIYEVGISYHGRSYQEGKKIGWQDALWSLWCILKYNMRWREGRREGPLDGP